jgi:hypothetical protein
MNPIGREILYTLALFRYFTWTLKAGIRHFELHLKENQNDCIKRKRNVDNFALENTQNIIRSINLATNYEVCSSYKETSSGKVKQTCCQITKSNSTKFNDGCSEPKSFLYVSSVPWVVIVVMMVHVSWFYMMWLLIMLLSRTEFDLKYPKCYKLEESRMSPSVILLKIIWEENGRVVSVIRRCVFTAVFSYCIYLVFWPTKHVFFLITVLLWGLSFSTSSLYRSKITNSSILVHDRIIRIINSGEIASAVKVLTLPFNVSLWRKTINKLHSLFTTFTTCVDKRFRNRILKMLALCTCYVLAVPICSLYVCIVFLLLIILAIMYPSGRTVWMLSLVNLHYKMESCYSVFLVLLPGISLLLFLYFTFIVMVYAIQSFLLGLFLNLIYFIPYFAFFSVLTFYCSSYWKTMEEKYCVLKRLIYEACRDKQQVNNGCIPNRHPKREEKVLPVVSKELYDIIREKLLPYHTNLFFLGLKIFWSFVFSFGIFQLINMLNQFNVTGVVQVVTTASLGIMPHIFNMVGLKTSEERKKAWEEKLKLNVKYMVEELVGEDSERVRTVLIMEEDNDGTTSEENIQDSEHVQASSDLNSADNVEDPELAGVLVIQDDIDTRADENVQARSGINPPDNADVEDPELAPTVVGQENNDPTAEENVRDSERAEAIRFDLNPPDDDDGLPIVIINSPPVTETSMRADDTKADHATADHTTADHTTADEIANDTTADDTTSVHTTADDRTAVDTTAGEVANDTTAVETTADDRTSVDTTAGEMADDTTADDTSAVDTTAGEVANDTTAVETTADDRTSVDTTAGEIADDTTADDTTADDRTTVIRPVLNPSDNDDVDDPELAGTVTRQECNDTTNEENIQDSERVEGFDWMYMTMMT